MTDFSHHRSIEAAAAAWLARRDATGRWTPGEEAALRAWISESAAHRVAWLRLEAAWRRTERLPALTSAASAQPRPRPRFARHTAFGGLLAASLVLALGLAWTLRLGPWGAQRYQTDVGNLEAVTLADGSRVTLNTHTRGRAGINDKERRFWLDEGEAFFEVTHDPARPFVVQAGRDTVTVLGTKFSVRYERGRTSVTVVEGRVRLDPAATAGQPTEPIVITRNEAAVVGAGSVLVVARTDGQVRNELSWREGRVSFNDMTLAEVAGEFNRYNRVQLEVRGAAANVRLSGNLEATNIEGFARLAHEGFGLTVQRKGDRIIIGAE